MAHDARRELPSLGALLVHPRTEPLLFRFSRESVAQCCRDILDELSAALGSGLVDAAALSEEAIVERLDIRLARQGGDWRVIAAGRSRER